LATGIGEGDLATPGLELAPLTPEIALDSSRLPALFHGDPADRIIIATARRMSARILTRDQGNATLRSSNRFPA